MMRNITKIFYSRPAKANTLWAMLVFFCLLTHGAAAQSHTRPGVRAPGGFEVNSYTGNLYYSRTDLQLTAPGLPLDITFSFNTTRRTKNIGAGNGWMFTYGMHLTPDSLGIFVEKPDGRRDFYKKNNAKYEAPLGVYDTLAEYQTGKWLLKTKPGIKYYFDNSAHKKLTRVLDLNNNEVTLLYNDTLLASVTDATGKSLGFTWQNGRLAEITDQNCAPLRKMLYQYDSTGKLVKITNPGGYTKLYYYDAYGRMYGYTDERGNNFSINYKPSGAVDKIVSCATVQQFTYISSQYRTIVTESVNGSRISTNYQFDTSGRIIEKKGNCCGFDMKYVYDQKNNITSTKDGLNNPQQYQYDNRGNIIRKTDASGNFSVYGYLPLNNKPQSVTDRNNKTTNYQYNAAGNLVQVNKPEGITESYTYDASGNMLGFTDGNNNTTTHEYSTAGYLIKTTGPENDSTLYAHDCRGNKIAETNPNGFTTLFEYDALNRPIKKTSPGGGVTRYTYDAAGNNLSIRNPRGKITRYEYDGLNRMVKTIYPSGATLQWVYDEQGNIIKKTDGNGNVTSFTYNSRRQKLSETDAAGKTRSFVYDNAGNLMAETDKKGGVTRYEYDALYHPVKKTDAAGNSIQFGYDAEGNKVAETDANGNITRFEYDGLKRVTRVTDPKNNYILTVYDGNGNTLSERDRNGNITTYLYDKKDRVKKTTDAENGVQEFTYDAAGNLLAEKDELGHYTTRTYNNEGLLLTLTNALNETTTYTYDSAGNVKTAIQPNGNIISCTYNDDNRLVQKTDNYGLLEAIVHDGNGNILSKADANGQKAEFAYDVLNRQWKLTDPENHILLYTYDANGNLLTETNRNGQVKSYTCNVLNRRISETDAMGFTTRFIFDANGNRISIKDAKNNTTVYAYDALNRKILETFANGNSGQFTYDAHGNLKTRKDNNGVTTTYTYDKLHRLITRSYSGGGTDQFTYDAASRQLTAVNATAAVAFTYDHIHRLLTETLNGRQTAYQYALNSSNRTLTYPSGQTITEEKDGRNRLSVLKENNNTLSTFSYTPVNQLASKVFANGHTINYQYNNNNRLTALTCMPGNLVQQTYTYDDERNRLTVLKNNWPARSEKFNYDANNRLLSFYTGTLSGNTLSDTTYKSLYGYDALHNLTVSQIDTANTIYASNNTNGYSSITRNGNTFNFIYDKNGNLLNDGSATYQYDSENRLISINNGTTARYYYDALGRKTKSISNGDTALLYYTGNQLIEQTTLTGTNAMTTFYGLGMDDIIAQKKEDSLFYFVNNPQGTPLLVFKNNTVLKRMEYNGTGSVFTYNNSLEPVADPAPDITAGFTGRPHYAAMALYDFRNRVYQPQYGRFLQTDQLGYLDGYNLYHGYFVPGKIDPLGTKSCLSYDYGFDILNGHKRNFLKSLTRFLPFYLDAEFGGPGIHAGVCREDNCCDGKPVTLYSISGEAGISASIVASSWRKRVNWFHSYFVAWLGLRFEGSISGFASFKNAVGKVKTPSV
jgi:RHS repeat-associated protein